MSAPRRVQMSRQHPWRADNPDAVIVDRRTRWGNPFKAGRFLFATGPKQGRAMTAADAVKSFRNLATSPGGRAFLADVRTELAGRDLACWCPLDQPCHADVLLDLAAEVCPTCHLTCPCDCEDQP